MKPLLFNLMAIPLIAGIFSRWRKKEEPDLDRVVLDQLEQAGSDLSKPHDVDFFLYFPSEQAANEAAKEINLEVDNLNVELGADDVNWLCFGTKSVVPELDELLRLRIRFNEIANKYDGMYDGWGTEVVK